LSCCALRFSFVGLGRSTSQLKEHVIKGWSAHAGIMETDAFRCRSTDDGGKRLGAVLDRNH
jgi:hypothetical protein